MSEQLPIISIIMPVFNGGNSIHNAINSIMNQGYNNIELIVVDGGSTDETDEIVRSYGEEIAVYISEPDNGYADALNKGIKSSTGELIMMLAADDVMIPGALEKAVASFEEDTDIWCGAIIISDGVCFRYSESSSNLESLKKYCSLHNPAAIFRRSVYGEVGLWDTAFKCANDREFFLRCYKAGLTFQVENIPLVIFAQNGLSSKYENARMIALEDLQISIQYGEDEEEAIARAKKRIKSAKRTWKRPVKKLLISLGLSQFIIQYYRITKNSLVILDKEGLAKYGCIDSLPPYDFKSMH